MPQATQSVLLPVPTQSTTQIYDELMAGIDPGLVSEAIAKLPQSSAGESDADRQARAERYERAFAAFEEAYAERRRREELEFGRLRREAMKSAEQESRHDDATGLATLEASFN